MKTKLGSIKLVNVMTPGAEVPVLGRSHISHTVNRHLKIFSTPGYRSEKLSTFTCSND